MLARRAPQILILFLDLYPPLRRCAIRWKGVFENATSLNERRRTFYSSPRSVFLVSVFFLVSLEKCYSLVRRSGRSVRKFGRMLAESSSVVPTGSKVL